MGIEQAAAGELAQHTVAHLLGDRVDFLRCGRDGRKESGLPFIARIKWGTHRRCDE